MSGYYFATTETASVAVDVYLENATGGYYLYAMIDGKKQYINIQTSADGQHVNVVYRDTADMVFKYDTAKNGFVTTKKVAYKDSEYYYAFGTRNDANYNTISSFDVEKYPDNFYAHLYQ